MWQQPTYYSSTRLDLVLLISLGSLAFEKETIYEHWITWAQLGFSYCDSDQVAYVVFPLQAVFGSCPMINPTHRMYFIE